MFNRNFILQADSYKYSHHTDDGSLYPPGTTNLYSYLSSRGGRYPATIFAGLQFHLKEYFEGSVFDLMDIDEAAKFMQAHGEPFATNAWLRMYEKHQGRLPLRVCAVPEGTLVPVHNVLMSVEVTDPEFFWLSSWVETMLSRVWYPTTVATQSHYIKRTILNYLNATSDDPRAEIDFKLHDFGARGVSSSESAAIGGLAHLFNFKGSDTVEGIRAANYYYNCEMAGYSIPATEHSTITSWGRDRELDAYRNVLKQYAKPGRIVACVSDSYDLYKVLENVWGGVLKEELEKSGATLVVRPDSGNPAEVVLETLETLADAVGAAKNRMGYRVLPPWLRVIQGDGINHDSITEILDRVTGEGFSASNVAFGMGGALLQQVNRDTQRFAYKCSEATIDGVAVPVMKDPITDPGKRSRAGRLALVLERDGLVTVPAPHRNDLLDPVFEDGRILKTYTLDECRREADASL